MRRDWSIIRTLIICLFRVIQADIEILASMASSNVGAIPKTGLKNKLPDDYKKMNDGAASESSEDHVYQQDIVEVGGTFDISQCDSARQSSTALKVHDQEIHQMETSIKKVKSQLKETLI